MLRRNVKGLAVLQASQVVLEVKNSPANEGDIRDVGLTPGSGSSWGMGSQRIPWGSVVWLVNCLYPWYYIQQKMEAWNSSSLVEQDVYPVVLAGCQFLSYRGGVCYLFILAHKFFFSMKYGNVWKQMKHSTNTIFFSFICSRMARLLPNRIRGSSWY